MADGLTLPSAVWRHGELAAARTAGEVRAFRVRDRHRSAFLVSGTEVLFLPRLHPGLDSVEVFNGWFPRLSRAVTVTSAVANTVARSATGRRVVGRLGQLAVGPAGGPDAVERARTRTPVVARTRDSAGRVAAEVHVEGPSIYALTGELLALGAELLATGRAQAAGVVDPLAAFGLDVLEDRCAAIGLEQAAT